MRKCVSQRKSVSQRKRVSQLILALVVMIGLAFLTSPGTEVNAAPMWARYIEYYSDATLSHQVGHRYLSCNNGQSSSSGVATEFTFEYGWACNYEDPF